MTVEIDKIKCEVIDSICNIQDEGEFMTYGMRAVNRDGKVLYEFKDITPEKEKVLSFIERLYSEHTPISHLHFAVLDYFQLL